MGFLICSLHLIGPIYYHLDGSSGSMVDSSNTGQFTIPSVVRSSTRECKSPRHKDRRMLMYYVTWRAISVEPPALVGWSSYISIKFCSSNASEDQPDFFLKFGYVVSLPCDCYDCYDFSLR